MNEPGKKSIVGKFVIQDSKKDFDIEIKACKLIYQYCYQQIFYELFMLEDTVYPTGFKPPPLLGHISANVTYENANISLLSKDKAFVIAGLVVLKYKSKDLDAQTTVFCQNVEIFNCDKNEYLERDFGAIKKRIIVPKFGLDLIYGQNGNKTEASLSLKELTFKITPSNYSDFSKINLD